MLVKKFKNGKIKLQLEASDKELEEYERENIYHDDMFMSDLYIETIEGNYIIVDFNTSTVYDYFNSYMIQNPLKVLIDDIYESEKGYIYLYPSDDNINTFDCMREDIA